MPCLDAGVAREGGGRAQQQGVEELQRHLGGVVPQHLVVQQDGAVQRHPEIEDGERHIRLVFWAVLVRRLGRGGVGFDGCEERGGCYLCWDSVIIAVVVVAIPLIEIGASMDAFILLELLVPALWSSTRGRPPRTAQYPRGQQDDWILLPACSSQRLAWKAY